MQVESADQFAINSIEHQLNIKFCRHFKVTSILWLHQSLSIGMQVASKLTI